MSGSRSDKSPEWNDGFDVGYQDGYTTAQNVPQLTPPPGACGVNDFCATPLESFPVITGGTWARETALNAAARLFQGRDNMPPPDSVLHFGEAFEEWLNRPVPDAEKPIVTRAYLGPIAGEVTVVWSDGRVDEIVLDRDPVMSRVADLADDDQAPSFGEMDEQMRTWKNVGVTRAALMYVINRVWFEGIE